MDTKHVADPKRQRIVALLSELVDLISAPSAPTPVPAPEEKLLSWNELADALGVSQPTARRTVRERGVTGYLVGDLERFKLSEVLAATRGQKPVADGEVVKLSRAR